MKKIFTTLALLALALPAHAHHLWIDVRDGAGTVNRGNIIKGKLEYAPACVKEIKAWGKAGEPLAVRRTDTRGHAGFTTGEAPALATAVSEWGYRVGTTRGKQLMPPAQARAEGFKIINVFKSTQFSKALFHPSPLTATPLWMKFEIVPLTDPLKAPQGRPVSFQLLFDDRPLPGGTVYDLDNKEIKTDGKGIFTIPLEKSGVYLFYAKHKIPGQKGQDIDYMKYMTFITFERTK